MSTYTVVQDAIKTKQQLVAAYHGQHRVMYPFALGQRGGRDRVLVYQVAGGSNSGLRPGGEWRCLNLDELSDVSARPGQWPSVTNWNDQEVRSEGV